MLSCVPAEDSFLEISPIPSQQKRRSWQSTILAKAALHNPVAKTQDRILALTSPQLITLLVPATLPSAPN